MATKRVTQRPANFGTLAYLQSFFADRVSPRRKPHVQTRPSAKIRDWRVYVPGEKKCFRVSANTKSEARAMVKAKLGNVSRLPVDSYCFEGV